MGKYIIYEDRFYGLKNLKYYEANGIVNTIMKQKYFDGLSQLASETGLKQDHFIGYVNTICWCVRRCNHLYLDLIVKYTSKNEDWIKYCLETFDQDQGRFGSGLFMLIYNQETDMYSKMKTLEKYIALCDKYNRTIKFELLSNGYKQLNDMYKNVDNGKDNLIQILSIIEDYCNKKHNKSVSTVTSTNE